MKDIAFLQKQNKHLNIYKKTLSILCHGAHELFETSWKRNCAIMIETFLCGKIYQDGLGNNVINIS